MSNLVLATFRMEAGYYGPKHLSNEVAYYLENMRGIEPGLGQDEYDYAARVLTLLHKVYGDNS